MSAGLRRYLYLTAAINGGAIMIVEILGAKMLSPFVGMSHFVWTAQIAVTLVALATGYYAGGRLADRSQKLSRLYWAMIAAAAYLAITVLICEPVAYWCLDFRLALGSLLASAILFFAPLALLAMTGPFLVRVITSSVVAVGGNVGRLTSISTLGSLVGTVLIGYFLVPFFANSVTMYFTAALLLMVAAVYFLLFNRTQAVPAMILVLLALTPGLRAGKNEHGDYQFVKETFRGNSHFGRLQVLERQDGGIRFYVNDNLIQNTYDPDKKKSASNFTYMLSEMARAATTNIQDVLCIGLGVGIVPMDFARQGARVDVVEINPAVVRVAAQFFDCDTNKISLTIDDGRHFLNRCTKQYDAVVLDAFLGDSSPTHLMTREAFTSMKKVLRPGGALVINSFGSLREGDDFFTTSLSRTLKAVFPSVRLFTSGDGAMFFTAMNREDSSLVRKPDYASIHPMVRPETEAAFASIVTAPADRGMVLTDNFNPAEYYDAHNREEIRRRLAMGARRM